MSGSPSPSQEPSEEAAAPATRGPQYQCDFCKEMGFKSEMLIDLDDPAMDWQGHLPMVCHECWQVQNRKPEYQWKAWKKVALE